MTTMENNTMKQHSDEISAAVARTTTRGQLMTTTQQAVEQYALATRDLVASFLRDWSNANPAVMERVNDAIARGATWQVETRLSPAYLPSVAIALVAADGVHMHLADLAFDAPAAVN